MRKIVLYIAMSLDGYIADKSGSVDWLGGDGSDPENPGSYCEFIDTVDTLILGHNTYHQIITELSPDIWPYEGKQSYVLTHHEQEDKNGIHFVNSSMAELLDNLKRQEGKDVWICGGADIINQALNANAVDELTISIIPTLVGDGIRLFQANGMPKSLTLISHRSYNGIVDLVYRFQ